MWGSIIVRLVSLAERFWRGLPRAASGDGSSAVDCAGVVVMGIDDLARVLLGWIRLANGLGALLAPGFLARQIGVDPVANPAIKYVFRMFGIRTVLIGLDLLSQNGERRAQSLRRAILIHASDTLAAWLATRSGRFPRRSRIIVWISAVNTVLAVIANRRTFAALLYRL